MLRLVLRRMSSSRWMIICLLIGSIMAIALVSSIPIYIDGILQRMLTKDLENYQLDANAFPGTYLVKSNLYYNYDEGDRLKAYLYFNNRIVNKYIGELNLPVLSSSQEIKLGNLYFKIEPDRYGIDTKYAQLGTLMGLDEHIKITNGRMYSKEARNGVYEVMVKQQTMKEMNLLLDKEYVLYDTSHKNSPVCKVKVVGVYTMNNTADIFWSSNLGGYVNMFLMNYDLFNKEFIKGDTKLITEATWFFALDYHKMTLLNIPDIINNYEAQNSWFDKYRGSLSFDMPSISIIQKYTERAKQLRTILWAITVPVLIMLTFYIFMVSQLIINHDENGIAVFKSRGASRKQIFLSYLIESLIIGITAFILGPPLGILICKILGASNGFLEFIQRTALPLRLNTRVYNYSIIAVVFLICTMLIPVISSSRISIVNYKQGKARNTRAPFWKRYFLDVLIIAVSAYGLYKYYQQQKVLSLTGIKASELQIDPLLFIASTLFVLGAGLLFLRIYPYLIRFIYFLGKKIWSPVMYISLIQVGRSRGQEQFLMLFIILAISTGIFNANSARTMNKNSEDKIRYTTGADVALMAKWEDNQPKSMDRQFTTAGLSGGAQDRKVPLRYYEPDYKKFSTLSGTESATKVLINNDASIQYASDWIRKVKVMGIIPNEFAKIAWFRADLLPAHWIYYLNMMTGAPKAFLVSSNLKEKYNLKEGDTIYLSWGEQSFLEGMIYAFIDYWPTFNPNPPDNGVDAPGLVVANLSYIQNKLSVQPYEVWIKKKPGATDKQINDDIIARKLDLSKIDYTNQQLIKMKNDPMVQGTNGFLTLGFVAAMVISTLGFLIYWIISIQTRILQFGILRAMGLSLAKVIGMLACEQILVSGAAILTGLIIGGITGDTFIPLLQVIYSSVDQVPPFKIVANADDYLKIYAVICSMLFIGFLTLWRLISKIRMDQAVKLGED